MCGPSVTTACLLFFKGAACINFLFFPTVKVAASTRRGGSKESDVKRAGFSR